MNLSVLLLRRRLMMLALNIVLETNETDSFYDTIKGYNGKVAETATLNKQFKQGKWDFICLPFDVNANMMGEVLDNVNAGTVNDQEVNNLIDMIQEQNAMGVENNMVNAQNNQPIMQQQQQKVNNQLNQLSADFFP